MNKLVNDEFNIIVEWETDDIERLISELQMALEDRYSVEEEQENLAHEAEARSDDEARGNAEYLEQQIAQNAYEAEQQGPDGEY